MFVMQCLQGEALLGLLAELDITQQSYSQHLQALLMDVSLTGGLTRKDSKRPAVGFASASV